MLWCSTGFKVEEILKEKHMTTRPTQSDEIDLFDVIEQLWRAKLTILLFCVVAMFLAATYAITSEKKFES